uniref:ATP-dependent DNA helicase n=1 Tax=Ilyobacter sp. TaxID=3100343 RepID=UPI003565AACB
KVARDYFSYEASKYSFTKTMNQIYNTGKKKKKKTGSYNQLINYLKNIKYESYKDVERLVVEELIERHINLFKKGNDYFLRMIDVFSRGQQGTVNLRLRHEELEHSSLWKDLKEAEEDLVIEYNSYMKRLRSLIRVIKEADDETGVINDFIKYIDRLEAFFTNFKFINEMDDSNFIYWISVNGKKSNAKLVATPLKINDELDKSLYLNLEHIVFTSATIAIGSDFHYFKNSIGLHEETLDAVIHSPFDYDRQMKVYIPKDIPLPSEKNFTFEIKDFLKELVRRAKGNTFILFTSYSTLNYMYYMLKDELEEEGFDLFIQGMAPRNKLVKMYKMSQKPVLFGTDSFWEGVDVKGEKLSSVIIVKLPFKVPSDPVVEAIIENLNNEGKNAFLEYQIPESIIKFKQGIGRLIRSRDDRGIITILDTRIVKKRYGKLFLNAIPTKNICIKTRREILN